MLTLNKFLLFSLLSLSLIFGCNSNKKEVLNLPEGLSIVSAVSDRKMADELAKGTKVVAFFYSERTRKVDLPRYNRFIEKYPEVGFVFYVNHKDDISLEKYMKEKKILVPVHFDPNQKFIRANKSRFRNKLTFMGFIVNSKNEILSMTNPSLPDFEQILKNEIRK